MEQELVKLGEIRVIENDEEEGEEGGNVILDEERTKGRDGDGFSDRLADWLSISSGRAFSSRLRRVSWYSSRRREGVRPMNSKRRRGEKGRMSRRRNHAR
jgi:hypothetical protein